MVWKLIFAIPLLAFCREINREFGLCHLYYNRPFEYQVVEKLNVQWARNDFLWEKIEAKKGEWDFAFYDQMVERLKFHQKKILGILDYDTPWLHRDKKSHRKITKENIQHFLKYVEKTVIRYKGKVDAWEIWNEPNNPFITKSKRDDFFELVKQTSNLIKSIDPNIFLVSGSLWLADSKYLEKMFKYGALEKADAISYHPYSISSELLPSRIGKMKSIMEKYKFKGQVWITEFGFPSHGIYFSKKFDPKKYPHEVIKSLTYMSALSVDKIFWYALFDDFNPGEDKGKRYNSEHYFGLAYPNGQFKGGGVAFSNFIKLLGDKKINPDLVNFNKEIKAFSFQRDNQIILVAWARGILPIKIRIREEISDLKTYNFLTGETSSSDQESLIITKYPQAFIFAVPKLGNINLEKI